MKVYTKNICQNFFFGPSGDDGTAGQWCSRAGHNVYPPIDVPLCSFAIEHHFSHIMTLGTENSKVVPLNMT